MQVDQGAKGDVDDPECSSSLLSAPPTSAPPPPPPPAPPRPIQPWYRRCRAKLFVLATSTLAFMTAVLYFLGESKVAVAAFDSTLKQLAGSNITFESWKSNITEAVISAVRSAAHIYGSLQGDEEGGGEQPADD